MNAFFVSDARLGAWTTSVGRRAVDLTKWPLVDDDNVALAGLREVIGNATADDD